MKRLLEYIRAKDWAVLVVYAVFTIIQVLLSLKLPDYMSAITKIFLNENGDFSGLSGCAFSMLLCGVGSFVCASIAGLCIAVVSTKITTRMRSALFHRIMELNPAEMTEMSGSSLITRSTNDVMQVQNFCSIGLQVLVQCPLTAIIALSKMSSNRVWLTAFILVVAVLLFAIVTAFFLSIKKTDLQQKLIDKINRLTKEHLSGMRVVHAYNGYEFQRDQFEKVNGELTDTSILVSHIMGVLSPMFSLATSGFTIIVYATGAVMIQGMEGPANRLMLFSQMMAFSSYALQAIAAFILIVFALVILPRTVVSVHRINEVIDTPQQICDGEFKNTAAAMGDEKGSIEFRNVSFAYPGGAEAVLSNISFTVQKGQVLAIIGATGSGKTSLVNLIPRFYDATDGAVLIDGRDVRDYKVSTLRDKIGYVPQKSFLFTGTIASNIDFGEKDGFAVSLNDIKEAAEIGQSKEFIEKKEGKYEARVEEGGSNFSGGQRQRLTITRAVCRKPEIYIFDDSFSALDFKTDARLRHKLRENAKDAIQIIVGQRIGSIMNADKILVLEKGRMVGIGKHDELLKNCPVYREIAESQLNIEEA